MAYEDWLSTSLKKTDDRGHHAVVTSSWLDPSAFNAVFDTMSEWSPPSTTYSVVGACIRRRTPSSRSSGQSGSRVPWANNRHFELQQNLIAKLRPVASSAEGIAKADDGFDRIGQGDMAADTSAHAFTSEHDRPLMLCAKRGERRSMSRNQLRQWVRPPSARQGVRVIERLDRTDRLQELREGPHSRMRGRRPGAGREEKGGTGHKRQSIVCRSLTEGGSNCDRRSHSVLALSEIGLEPLEDFPPLEIKQAKADRSGGQLVSAASRIATEASVA